MAFTYSTKREQQSAAQRSVVQSTRGMAASSQPLATMSGISVLKKGGNAVDAAVAMVGVLSVVEPHSVGIGGDAFALIHLAKDDLLIGMNGSGRAPCRASVDWFEDRGIQEIPERGILSVTVPGALHAWAGALERYGTMKLADVLEDAIYYAEEGFPVTEIIAGEWKHAAAALLAHPASAATFLKNGRAPAPGERFRNEELARTLKTIAHEGVKAFYEGEICDAIIRCSENLGGLLSREDFRDHTTTWVEPISSDYRGFTVYELPPNGQGITVLEMLNILEGYDIGSLSHNGPEHLHLVMEAKKAAFSDRDTFVTDPGFEPIPLDQLLSKEYAERTRRNIDLHRAKAPPPPLRYKRPADTVYVTAVDKDRNAVSLISSIFQHFGSGIVADGTGIMLQNRGKSFSLDRGHFNRLEPRKRPMHTIIPAMLFRDGRFAMSFGVVGADMQPQGQVQFLLNLIDFGFNIQEAMDAPRARHLEGMEIYLEDGIREETRSALHSKGHRIIEEKPVVNQAGGGQAIWFDRAENALLGASDRRKDGAAIGY